MNGFFWPMMTRYDYHMVMKRVGVAELKARLSEHLRSVRAGESVVVLDRRTPIARLVPFEQNDEGLVVEAARGSLQRLTVPEPALPGTDILDELLAERGDRL
jgi:prevent-host-death family protein